MPCIAFAKEEREGDYSDDSRPTESKDYILSEKFETFEMGILGM